MSSVGVCAVLALVTAAFGHPEAAEDSARRLSFLDEQHIWSGPAQCSDHLSDGPADADLELHLGGLPASTAGETVHLQWWAPRRSHTQYDPLVSPVNCSVYSSIISAYPKFSDAEFNGGNVRISEAGEAVIRVRTPSTYFVRPYVARPHIHLRLCRGASGIENADAAVQLAGVDIWVQQSTGEDGIRVISAGFFAGRSSAPASSASPQPVAVVRGVVAEDLDCLATTLPPSAALEPFVAAAAPVAATSEREALVSSARNGLNLDALEFSPVYRCLLDGHFFDHFSAGCARECPTGAGLAHGQCVRREIFKPLAEAAATWQLEVVCGATGYSRCLDTNIQAALHGARLTIAGHSDIPFQEVKVSLTFKRSTGRQLGDKRTAYMTASVSTRRLLQPEVVQRLASFRQDVAAMRTLLGMFVVSVVRLPPGADPANFTGPILPGQGSDDPYERVYDAVEPPSATGVLPGMAIVGIAVGVVLFALACGLWWKLLRLRKAQEVRAQEAWKKSNLWV
mmetsp:Transcript_71693/g.214005  ORF Transcript_71693/g.214005 Transcript_71693/m.214005 type:complete len:510 (+) Transcript_71693:47-1576(+)